MTTKDEGNGQGPRTLEAEEPARQGTDPVLRDAHAVVQLPSASSNLLQAADTVRELEREKRRAPISSPRFHALADRIEREARRVFSLASREERLGNETHSRPESIEDVEGRSARSGTGLDR
jgi:hypothetical protein